MYSHSFPDTVQPHRVDQLAPSPSSGTGLPPGTELTFNREDRQATLVFSLFSGL